MNYQGATAAAVLLHRFLVKVPRQVLPLSGDALIDPAFPFLLQLREQLPGINLACHGASLLFAIFYGS